MQLRDLVSKGARRLLRLAVKSVELPYLAARSSGPVRARLDAQAQALSAGEPLGLSPEGRRVLEALRRDGIATTSIRELYPAFDTREFVDYARELDRRGVVGRKKSFLKFLWPEDKLQLPLESPFIKLALSGPSIDSVRSYLGCAPRLRFVSLNTTLPVPADSPAVASQRWHRDPGLGRILKIFVYASDVDERAGPFTYVRGSHGGGRYESLFPATRFGREGSYPAPGAVEAAVDPRDIFSATGTAGSVIFCDTLGLHRGGYATHQERIMFTAHFERPSGFDERRYRLPEKLPALTPLARFAIGE